MRFPIYLTDGQCEQLKYEKLSKDIYGYLTRFLNDWCENVEDTETIIARKNRIINFARTVSGGKIYRLESDDWGGYHQAEYAWHDSHFLLIFRELSILEFVEFCGDLIAYKYLTADFVNKALAKEKASFKYIQHRGKITVEVYSIEEIEAANVEEEHVNIRTLVARMDAAHQRQDFAEVLHASASVFETMAKEIIGLDAIQDKTLKSFFERYRKDSNLPEQILDYILAIYNDRNETHLAGHGGLVVPDITFEQSVMLSEMTKAFVRIEYQIHRGK